MSVLVGQVLFVLSSHESETAAHGRYPGKWRRVEMGAVANHFACLLNSNEVFGCQKMRLNHEAFKTYVLSTPASGRPENRHMKPQHVLVPTD